MVVSWSDLAKEALKHIFDYIALDSESYARITTDKIFNETIILSDFPRLGRMVPELNDENIRELILFSYRVIYEIKDCEIEVLNIIAGKQNFFKTMENQA